MKKLRNLIYLFLVLLCALAFAFLYKFSTLPEANASEHKAFIEAKLTKVTDGDTVYGLYQGLPIKVRLYGIDAPERKQKGGATARKNLQAMLPENLNIELMDIDNYGRFVGIVHLGQGETAQAKLLQNGDVWFSAKYCKINICSFWSTKQKQAKAERLGLWQDENPTPPWEFRK